jgi:hypothetical protein
LTELKKGNMQIIADVPKRLQHLIADNASTLLTAGGVVGTVATAVLSGRAGFKAGQLANHDTKDEVQDIPYATSNDMGRLERTIKTAPLFIPPVLTGSVTIASIILSNRMSAQRAAALAAAYGVSQRNLDEYKAKLAEKLGVTKTEKAKAELAQERADKTPGANAIVIFGDEVLCFDEPTGRYFKSTMERIRRAENAANKEIIVHNYAPASMFYSELELPGTTWSDDVGWSEPFSLEISTIMVDDKPCISIDFDKMPVLDYVRGGNRWS